MQKKVCTSMQNMGCLSFFFFFFFFLEEMELVGVGGGSYLDIIHTL